MFDNIGSFFRKIMKTEPKQLTSKDAAKERLHLVLMQDRANVSADFLELMKQEIINVIKKYIDIDEKAIDVRLTNQQNDDGTNGAPALYANIPIVNIKSDMKVDSEEDVTVEEVKEETEIKPEEVKEESKEIKEEKLEETVTEETVVEEKETEADSKKDEEDDVDVPTFDELLKQSEEEVKEKSKEIKEEVKEEKKSTKSSSKSNKSNKKN